MRIAIIPARGGSKRIPRKNLRQFGGIPIIAHSIRAALRSELFDQVVVSTDDAEIATVARHHGAAVPFRRPAALAGDHTGTAAVVQHALAWFATMQQPIDLACCIYATAPFIRTADLREGLTKLESSDRSFAFSVTSFGSPIQRALRLNADGAIDAFWPEHISTRTQDLEPAYYDAGQFYWGRAQAFLEGEALFSPRSLPIILPRYLVHDIDTEEDWIQAEIANQVLHQAGLLDACE